MATDGDILRAIGKVEGMLEQALHEMRSHTDRMNRIDQDIEDVRTDIASKTDTVYVYIDKKVTAIETTVHDLDKKNFAIFAVGSVLGFLINLAVGFIKK